ncbi:MAG: OmpA family protein, partial [Gammaproteobacteria bacterium]
MKEISSQWLKTALLAIAVAAASAPTYADDTSIAVFHDRTPTSTELVDALKVKPRLPDFTGRGLRKREAAPPAPPTASLKVNFAFGSYALTSQAKHVLNNLAGALKHRELRDGSFMIEGHTDAVGSDAYNMHLSEQRARAVKQHLVNVHGIAAARLTTAGFGERALLVADDPNNGENRRVQVKNTTE